MIVRIVAIAATPAVILVISRGSRDTPRTVAVVETIEQVLIASGVVDAAQLARAVAACEGLGAQGPTLIEMLVRVGAASERRIGEAIADRLGLPLVVLGDFDP
jgi:hypothetical protein